MAQPIPERLLEAELLELIRRDPGINLSRALPLAHTLLELGAGMHAFSTQALCELFGTEDATSWVGRMTYFPYFRAEPRGEGVRMGLSAEVEQALAAGYRQRIQECGAAPWIVDEIERFLDGEDSLVPRALGLSKAGDADV